MKRKISGLKMILPKGLISLLGAGLFFSMVASAYAVTETFTTSGAWTCPAGVTSVTVEVWGGGGGGGGDNTKNASNAGGGGGGGAYAKRNIYAVTPGNNYSYTVGTAGAAGAVGAAGGAGGDSFFVSTATVMAKGGSGGQPDGGAGGAGGAAGSSVGDVKYSGGSGFTSNSTSGGGGGGSAGTGANGNSAASATGAMAVAGGGPGGDGGAANATGSAPVSGPGGGGGGAGDRTGAGMTGGAGYAGQIRLTYTVVASAPSLTLPTATTIGSTTATLGATVSSDGGAALTARGTVWDTATAPLANQLAEGGTTVSAFSHARASLSAQTKIFYRGYATNSAGTSYSPEGSFYTEPATQASAVSFSGITSTGMTINWTRGSGGAGGGVLVVMKAGSAVDATPADGTYTGYAANAAFAGGTQITAGNYVVYKGTGTSVAVTGLSPTTTYHVAVFEFAGQVDTAGDAQGTNYKLTPAVGSQATPAAPVDTLSVTANTPVATAAAPLATDVQMQVLQVDSNNGDNGNVVLATITVDDLGSVIAGDFANIKVHVDTDNNFGNGVLGTVTEAGFTGSSTVVSLAALPAADRTVTNGTSKYIWITYDVAASADTKTIQSSVTALAVDSPDNGASGTWNSNLITVASGPSSTLADCAGCHNYPPVDAASRDTVSGNFIGDHDKHSAYTCATCHITPATETSIDFAHRTGQLNMDSGNIGVGTDNGTYSKGTNFAQSNTPTYGTCSLVDCHSNAVTPQWGVGTTACNSCHTLPPATNAHAAHYTAKGWAADNTNCTVCHPNNTTGHSDVTDGSVTVNAGLNPSGVSPAITCAATPTGCHNGKTTPAWNTSAITCASCHTAGGAAAGDPASGLHATTAIMAHDNQFLNTPVEGAPGTATCTSCHSSASPSSLHFDGTVQNAGAATYTWNTVKIPAGYNRTTDACAAVCHTDSGTWNREWSGAVDTAWAYANDAATATVCGNCHGSFATAWNIIGSTSHDNPDADNDPDTLATSRASHSECSACHAWGHTNYSTGNKHENNLLEMNSTLDSSPGDGNCTTTCHGGLTLTMDPNSGWTDAGVAGDGVVCGGCHTGGVTTASASGAHTIHGATSASVAANPASIALCISCHGNDGTGATHNNGTLNFASVNYSAARGVLTGTCNTSNCHNYDPNIASPTKDRSTAWNTSALACDDCHYYSATPTSAGNAAHARPLSTSHNDHFAAGKLCAQCHGADPAAGDTAHIGGVSTLADKATALQDEASLVWTHASAVTDYTFDDTGNTCYSATNSGLGCHATAGAAGAADPTRPDWDVAFASTACTSCHTNTSTTAVNPTSGLHGVIPSVSGKKHDQTLHASGCAICHTSIPAYSTHKDGTFAGGNGQTSTMGLAAFYTQTADNTGTCANANCHLGVGNTDKGSDAWAHKWDSTAGYYTTSPSACLGCHGNLASGFNAGVDHLVGGIATDHADDGTASNYGCEACHALQASTNVYPFTFSTADWAPLNAGNKHGNGLITMNDDAGGTISGWARGTGGNATKSICLKCHTDWTDSAPQHWFVNTTWTPEEIAGDGISAGHGVGADCKGCHAATQGTRRGVQAEFPATLQHGAAWTSMTNADCEKCHVETSGPDSAVQLKVWNADNTTFTTATYDKANLSSANTHCLSCHDATRGVTIAGLSPPARSMANYTSTTTYNNHNFNAAGTWGTAVVPQKAKAISAHGNPGGNQLKNGTDTMTTALGCLHCHPSHGSSVASKATTDANNVAVASRMLGGKPSELASVGLDYTGEGTLADPQICWNCHGSASVNVADYYGNTTTGNWNVGGIWKSPTFAYKTGKGGILSVHIAVKGGASSDAAASIVCSSCHDVHGSPTVAQFYSPMLKGKWLTSPYFEDRAPQSYATTTTLFNFENANALPRGGNTGYSPRAEPTSVDRNYVASTTWVPKEIGGGYGTVGTQNGAWGYFIDANTFGMDKWATESAGTLPVQRYFYNRDSTNFNNTSMTNFAGLCMAQCHTQAAIDTATGNWSGHKATVPGFGGATTIRDLFNITPSGNQLANGRDQVGKHYYSSTDYGQNLFAMSARQGGNSGAMDGKDYSHNLSVSWGVTVASTTATTQANYHQFPCSKCHNPHASVLPKLMRTNCLDVKQSSYEYRMSDEAANCHRVEQATPTLGVDAFGGADTYDGVTNGRQWNTVTPW